MARRAALSMAATAIAIALAHDAPARTLAGLAAAHDGDTLYIENEPIRLAGIDAPELAQRCADGAGSA